jgi:hypothetical protein
MSSDRIPKKDLKLSTKRKIKSGKTSEAMEAFCFTESITDLNRRNTEVEYDDDDTVISPNLSICFTQHFQE